MSKPPVTADPRRIALTAPPAQFDISPPSTTYGVWAVLMDTTSSCKVRSQYLLVYGGSSCRESFGRFQYCPAGKK
jgi:hypothetical protein